nr:hypothetical protein [uncultured Devosia sp.]
MSDEVRSNWTESLWDFLNGSLSKADCVAEIRANGLQIDEEELGRSRLEDRPAVAFRNGEVVRLIRPSHIAINYN